MTTSKQPLHDLSDCLFIIESAFCALKFAYYDACGIEEPYDSIMLLAVDRMKREIETAQGLCDMLLKEQAVEEREDRLTGLDEFLRLMQQAPPDAREAALRVLEQQETDT